MIVPAERITASDTRPLRHAILRPSQPLDACVYPGDDDAAAFHLGVREGFELVAVASFYRASAPGSDSADLRIRGMAVQPEHRGRGHGRRLVDAGPIVAGEQPAAPSCVWCNARTSAAGYYARLGFTQRGDVFEIEGIGPHVVMVRAVPVDSLVPANGARL